jgi:hypothetical protein
MAAPGPGPSFKAPQPRRWPGPLPGPVEMIQRAVDTHYRAKDGEISRKHRKTLVRTLRISYGSTFAKGCANDEKLSDVLAKLDEPSLFKLVRDHKIWTPSYKTKDSLGHSARLSHRAGRPH